MDGKRGFIQHHLHSSRKRNYLFNLYSFCRSSGAGFTLIELLIVIVVLGVLATVVMIAINPLGMINSANLAKTKTFSASVENLLSISQVGKWSFDDPANPGKDTSGYGNSGTITGATWLDANSCGLGFGGCLSFDGSNDYVQISNVSETQPITISLWAKSLYGGSGTGYRGSLIYKNPGYSIGPTTTGDKIIRFGVWTSSTTADYANGYSVPNPGNWHHFVFTFNDLTGEKKTYVDGVSVDTRNIGSRYLSNAYIRIGEDMIGLIDEVAIYSQALLSSQIQQLYAQGLIRHQLAME